LEKRIQQNELLIKENDNIIKEQIQDINNNKEELDLLVSD